MVNEEKADSTLTPNLSFYPVDNPNMDPSRRATVFYNLTDLDRKELLIRQGVRKGDVVIIDGPNGAVRYIFDGDMLIEINPGNADLPRIFDVPDEFPPRYWTEAFLTKPRIPTTFNLVDPTPDVYISHEPDGNYLIIPFLSTEYRALVTEDNVYYIMTKLDDGDTNVSPEQRDEEANSFTDALFEDTDNHFYWIGYTIAGIDPDRILMYRY